MILGISMLTLVGPNLVTQTYAQNETESEKMEMGNMSNVSAPASKIPSMSTPGEKTFYIFPSEIENVNENK